MDNDHHGEGGATAVEYGLLVALIGAVILGGVTLLGAGTLELFSSVCNGMSPFTC